MLVGSQGVEDQSQGAGHQHVIGEIEDRTIEADGIDVEVDEIADMSENQAIVAVAHRTGHDQRQGDRQGEARCGAEDEKPVANDDGRDDREAGEDQAAVGQIRPESPECAGVLAGLQLEDPEG